MSGVKVKLAKKINGALQILNSETTADAVVYDSSLTVQEVLDTLINAVDNLEESLSIDTLYITTSNGTIVTDDEGTGTVAVASLTAVEVTSSDDITSTTSDDDTSTTSDDSSE